MSEVRKNGWLCVYEGEEHISSKRAVCAKCKASIMYDPYMFEMAKMQNPGFEFEFFCIPCGLDVFPEKDIALDLSRRAMRGHPLVGTSADLVSNEWMLEQLRKRRRQ